MIRTPHRWVLAFDATCGTCKDIAHAVEHACRGKLEVRPLADDEVRRLRERAMGADPVWAPTLLRVDGDRVRAWTGAAMSMTLARRLGPADSVRVIHALGTLRRRSRGHASELPGAPTGRAAIGRAQFLRFGAGAGVAAGLVLAGKVPAFADDENQAALAWVRKHSKNLPHAYENVIKYPLRYRRAIFNASTVNVRRDLWMEHLVAYRKAHPNLTKQQSAVIDRAWFMLEDSASTFAAKPSRSTEQKLAALHKDAVAAFGNNNEVHTLLGALGTAAAPSAKPAARTEAAAAPDCPCFDSEDGSQDFCNSGNCTVIGACVYQPTGCGVFWTHPCNGSCV
ncbi:bacteriocin fulvocin C-related protein [Actinoallomurus iriomotensis]|uniref:Uncharacterized protein n=1 Tax=Actinoallomurus iriomotensis TaxID=478107 RepID=A0A9W6RQX5_9ACTN|nr:bacteriocin fulvocin C-related protein [Actinoallomurus iriomotensis]GLY80194.1 hypothetical protein Airi01_084610 [Actinoallomurus iriomotensis]